MWPRGTLSWENRDRGELDYDLYPQGDSSYTLYEDDGVTRRYAAGSSATQQVDVHAHGPVTTVEVGASEGSYSGKPDARSYRFTVHGRSAPRMVVTQGGPLPRLDSAAALDSAASGWYFDGATGVTHVKTAPVPTDEDFSLHLIHGGH